MNIKNALKRKNKLVGLVSEEFQKVSTYNSVIEGNDRPYNIEESLKQWEAYTRELAELKAKIHRANAPILEKIFLISELKSQIKSLKGLSCEAGKVEAYRYSSGNADVVKTAIFGVVDKEKKIKAIEAEIETIQDELDDFNFKTEI